MSTLCAVSCSVRTRHLLQDRGHVFVGDEVGAAGGDVRQILRQLGLLLRGERGAEGRPRHGGEDRMGEVVDLALHVCTGSRKGGPPKSGTRGQGISMRTGWPSPSGPRTSSSGPSIVASAT